MISIKYVINNIEFVVSTCISVLAIIVSAVVAKNILKKELKENSSYEITKKSITFEKKGNDWKSKEYEEMFK